jgi:hypothetical protein
LPRERRGRGEKELREKKKGRKKCKEKKARIIIEEAR